MIPISELMLLLDSPPTMKITTVTCYHEPNYVRAATLRNALNLMPENQVQIIKNTNKNIIRYPEVIFKLIYSKFIFDPDCYLLTFRGQEILPIVLFIAGKKPVIFDEFIIPIAWAKYENHKKNIGNSFKIYSTKLLYPLYNKLLNKAVRILSDTQAHSVLSSHLSGLPITRYSVIPVGADETLFISSKKATKKNKKFIVFFYGGMYPLHGLRYILEATVFLKQHSQIKFIIAGGDKITAKAIHDAQSKGANIKYKKWVNLSELPNYINRASLCLAGPFGNTVQAESVITGKTYQYLACSAPTLLGDNSAVRDHFKDDVNSLIVKRGDSALLAEKILWAFKNKNKLSQIGINGKALYDKQFSTSEIALKLNSLFQELI
jgi:glycosyltransferase involved in cell wall biosynthesis